jgi:thermostable 8-oxoguanine DNA glycosylase
MKLLWRIEDDDVRNVLSFFEQNKDNPLVVQRQERNVGGNILAYSRSMFWREMVVCLLTTQQRAGPNSAVSRFAGQERFLLSYEECKQQQDLETFASSTLASFRGIRRHITIGKEIDHNFRYLENDGGWKSVDEMVEEVSVAATPEAEVEAEIEAAAFVDYNLKGFGPKQARNLLQGLGLTKYEIPIDSRITKWLNEFGFPVELSAGALSDLNYYKFVSEGFRELCEACDIYPCLMDAAIFSSFDIR